MTSRCHVLLTDVDDLNNRIRQLTNKQNYSIIQTTGTLLLDRHMLYLYFGVYTCVQKTGCGTGRVSGLAGVRVVEGTRPNRK